MSNKHILILGSGSVGKRHARNLSALGCRISCFDPREDRCAELAAETPVVRSFTDQADAFRAGDLDGVLVASPTVFHPAQTIEALELGLPVFLEKPPARTLSEAESMVRAAERSGTPVLLGYTWRWWPPLIEVRKMIESGAIGRVLHVQFHMSAHLADWHPWERYQDFFMASAGEGGGALLDESHWIDLMIWFFGRPAGLYGRVERISDLEIDSDDNVDIVAVYSDRKRVTIHLDLYGRPHEKFIRFVGDGGTILWSADPNRISTASGIEQKWEHRNFTCERNDMFVGAAREFIEVLDGAPVQTCRIEDGLEVMELIEAVRKSNKEQRMVEV